MLVEAYHVAMTGRPGAVLLDLPKDVQGAVVTMEPWEDLIVGRDWSSPEGHEADIRAAARVLSEAVRPLLYVGHGAVIAGATDQIRTLSLEHDIPGGHDGSRPGTLPLTIGSTLE